jgi:hypothetical protein
MFYYRIGCCQLSKLPFTISKSDTHSLEPLETGRFISKPVHLAGLSLPVRQSKAYLIMKTIVAFVILSAVPLLVSATRLGSDNQNERRSHVLTGPRIRALDLTGSDVPSDTPSDSPSDMPSMAIMMNTEVPTIETAVISATTEMPTIETTVARDGIITPVPVETKAPTVVSRPAIQPGGRFPPLKQSITDNNTTSTVINATKQESNFDLLGTQGGN